MRNVVELAPSPEPRVRFDINDERVRTPWQSILERRVTTLRYLGRNRGWETVRRIEPRWLGYANGAWYLTACCRERQEEHLDVRSKSFHARPATPSRVVPSINVVVRFRGDISRWVRERQHWSVVAEDVSDNELLARR